MKQEKIAYLDGWRGVAIALVLIGHFFPYWRFRLAPLGVDVFFVLSGLLMTRLLFVDKTPLPIFYKRRIARIFPAFYFFVAAVVAVYAILGLDIAWQQMTGALLLIRNYYPEPGTELPFDHIWSLSVEEHSYIALSVVAIFTRRTARNPKYTIAVAMVFCIAFSCYYAFTAPVYSFAIRIRTEVSAFGILCSSFLYLHFQERMDISISPWIYPTLMAIALSTYYFAIPSGPINLVGVGALAILVNILHKAPSVLLRLLSFRLLGQLGVCSFSIYLWQQPFYQLTIFDILPAWAGLVAAISVGGLSYYLLENPLRAYLNNRWGGAPICRT